MCGFLLSQTLICFCTGYGSELFYKLAEKKRWVYGKDYTFVCLNFADVIADLVTPGGQCDVACSALLVRQVSPTPV